VIARIECTAEAGEWAARESVVGAGARRTGANGGTRAPDAGDGVSSYRIDFLAYPDPSTGFSAVERASGFSAAIVCAMQAHGEIAAGAAPVETAVPAERFLERLSRREFKIVHAKH
jgi:hypothetical protein